MADREQRGRGGYQGSDRTFKDMLTVTFFL
jgi:hypothetical protein